MAIFGFFRVLLISGWRLHKFRRAANRLRRLALADFIPEWKITMDKSPDGSYPILNAAASPTQILETEERLGCIFTDEISAFYGVCNGIRWNSNENKMDIVPLHQLRYSSQYEPSLSVQAERKWENSDVGSGVPKGLVVISDNFVNIFTDTEERVLPFKDIDKMVAIQAPLEGKAILAIVHTNPYFPLGTILEVEGLSVTRFDNLRSWLASLAATNAMLSAFE